MVWSRPQVYVKFCTFFYETYKLIDWIFFIEELKHSPLIIGLTSENVIELC